MNRLIFGTILILAGCLVAAAQTADGGENPILIKGEDFKQKIKDLFPNK